MAITLAHISDTHLGFRAYGRTDEYGINLREQDVMRSFTACLNSIADREPDLVVHSGDFFHVVRPSNATIIAAYTRLADFQKKRGYKPFVLIAGNHDTPKTADSGNLLKLFASIEGIRVFTGRAESWEHAGLDLEVLALPHVSLATQEEISWRPQTSRAHSLLVLHGIETQVATELRKETSDFEFQQTGAPAWTYVAMGDVHVYRQFAANACYAGATDFTSSDPWSEIGIPKGWVWFADGQMDFVETPCRTFIDLPSIDATGLTAQQMEELLVANAVWNADELPVVRQRVRNLARETGARLGVEWRREVSALALNYQLDATRGAERASTATQAEGEAVTLETEWDTHMKSAPLPGGVKREAVTATGLDLLREVEAVEVAAIEA